MSLRGRLIAYLVAAHVLFGTIGVIVLLDHPLWLLGVEALFAASLAIGVRLAGRVLRSVSLGGEAVRLIRDQELTSRLLPVGDPDADALIDVYNRMVDSLRAERVRAEEQQHFFRDVIRSSPAGLLVLDFDGAVAEANPAAARLLHVELPALAGRRLESIGSPLANRLATLAPNSTETVQLSGPRRVRCHHGTFFDRGFVRSFLLLEELTEDLRQFERAAYEKLIRVMSHEVNNTVTAANSLLESSLTYGRELAPASRLEFERAIGIAMDRTAQLSRFMRGFAEVYRLPAPVPAPVELRGLLEPVVRLLAAGGPGADRRWVWRADGPVTVMADRTQLEQACLNVLKNAVEAAPPGGTVTIRIALEAGRPVLEIEDTGPGLDPEARENIFTPFFSTKPHGHGIGLTLVQEVLMGHGCAFGLEGPPGGPTRFRVVFPA